MAHGSRHKLRNLVPHPHYGSEVIPSGHTINPATLRGAFYSYPGETCFPESAIPADIKKQNFSTFPRFWYVDILKTCRDCKRNFLFFALEQKHWFEVLGFYIDADCVRCPDCRKTDQTLRNRFKRYSQFTKRSFLDDESLATLVSDAVFLWQHALLKNPAKLHHLKRLAAGRIPEHKATLEILSLVKSLKTAKP